VLAATLALDLLAATYEPSRVQLTLDADFAYTSYGPAAGFTATPLFDHAVDGGAGPTLTIFADRRVVDDDSPLSLQPFLQRLTTLQLFVGGNGRALTQARPGSVENQAIGKGSIAADAYVHRNVAVTASLGVEYSHDSLGALSSDSVSLPVSFGIGVRVGDLRMDLGYSIVVENPDKNASVPFLGDVSLTAHLVVRRKIELILATNATDGGAQARFSFEYFLQRNLGVFASAWGGSLRQRDVSHPGGGNLWNVGGNLGLAYWVSRHFGAVVRYAHTHQQLDPIASELDDLSVALLSRWR
jgi:hypothetical protein